MNNIGFLTAGDAEAAFYQAFENADLQQMMQVWSEDESIICIHPMSIINQGISSVRESWHQIFQSAEKMRFEINPAQRNVTDHIAAHIVTETIYITGDHKPRPPILATNIYHNTPDGWRMILHHASPSVIDTTQPEKHPSSRRHLH